MSAVAATPPRADLDELKARVDLVELFRACGLEPKRKGKNWLCRCPFHEDSEASLSINSERQLFQCFGCKKGGDALSFLQLKEELEFTAAVRRLEELAGALPAAPAKASVKKELPGGFKRGELLARVAELYHKRFAEVADGRDYLSSRGLDSPELWKAFQAGFCDGTLRQTLPEDGPILEALQAIGVLTAEGKEHFRGCVVVPLTHPDRGVVGLYGRRIRPDAKNRHLYLSGTQRGVLNWQALKASGSVVITESVLDALSFWQAGVREVTCLFGAAALPASLPELLERFKVREATWCLDGDRAGLEAVQALTPRLAELGLHVKHCRLPDGADPNSFFCSSGGGPALKRLLLGSEVGPSAPASSAPAVLQPVEKGFLLELGSVSYRVEMIAPFSSRLRANVSACHSGGAWTQDRLDFFTHRDRTRFARHLITTLGLSRPDGEAHVGALLRQAEEWVKASRQSSEDSGAKQPEEMSEEERGEAMRFLRHPQLSREILTDMAELGFIGEEKAKLLTYLISLSRKLPKPMSGIVLSQAGCGKSTLTDLIEQLTPPEDVLMFTRITPQALQYMAEQMLKGKIIIVEERTGAESAEYSIRVLQSKQKLVQAVPQKDPATGKITTQIITVEGPVAYLETTTDPKINHENATRCFEITLDESQEQTERIQQAQRTRRLPTRLSRERQADQIKKRHHNAQRLLEPILVFIPFADQLIFPSRKLRNRRDHERFLCLIEASAFLHQQQRERGTTEDGDAYVLASVDDYRLAYDLAQEVLAITLHELSRGAQDVWRQVCEWVWAQARGAEHDFLFTRRDLRQVTGAEDHQLRTALQELVEMEYLEVAAGANGRAFQYRLLVTNQEQAPVTLLSPEELQRRLDSSMATISEKKKQNKI